MDHGLALLHTECRKAQCMQARLAIIDHALLFQSDNYVLIQKSRIVGWRLDVSVSARHPPRTGPEIVFARDRRKSCRQAAARRSGTRGNQFSKEPSMSFQCCHPSSFGSSSYRTIAEDHSAP
jgi:hypothetical protein